MKLKLSVPLLIMGLGMFLWLGAGVETLADQTPAQGKSALFLGGAHAKAGVACADCHGQAQPKEDDEVENDKCLACHGPLDKLAAKTRPAKFADRNPHQSHLGEIGCGVCHKAHAPSAVYCLGCHAKFGMKIKHDQ